MNARDRVRAALTCQRPDRIPKALTFFRHEIPAIVPATPEDYFGLDVRIAQFEQPVEQADFLAYLRKLPPDVHVGNVAQLSIYHEWDYHPEMGQDRPLSHADTIAELAEFVFPDLRNPRRYAGLNAQIATWHDQGLAVAGSPPHLGGELFEMAYRLRGFDKFLSDLVLRQPLAHYLLDQLAALTIHSALILAQAGIDILLLDDDVAMPTGLIVSPGTWRTFFKPRLADIIRLAREAAPDFSTDSEQNLIVFYHSDGDFTALIPDLLEIGVNVINPVQPDCMDAPAIKQAFGDRLAIWGAVGSAAFWDHGTPDDVRAATRHSIETLGPEGLLPAPAYDVDFTPLENLVAFYEAIDEYGAL